jgi:hypothetical protein
MITLPGMPYPLGAHYSVKGVNFAFICLFFLFQYPILMEKLTFSLSILPVFFYWNTFGRRIFK